jgi:polysaccharide biosynthesis protein PslH
MAMKRQIECCKQFGFKTYFLAVSPAHYVTHRSKAYWKEYLMMSNDLGADDRSYIAQSKLLVLHPEFWIYYPKLFFRSYAYAATLHTRILKLPANLIQFIADHDVDSIICNHYFNLPVADRVRKLLPKARLILETQDIQSQHYFDSHPVHPIFRTRNSLASMLKDEMEVSRTADVFVHYNEAEAAVFQEHIPEKTHHVIFPAVQRNHSSSGLQTTESIFDFLIVASANDPNLNSLVWFFEKVWNEEFEKKFNLKIVGNIDKMLKIRQPGLFSKYQHRFVGRVDDLSKFYGSARVVLLPVIEGHGVAVKTIEAISFGKVIVATPLSYRGFEAHLPDALKSEIAHNPEEFQIRMLKEVDTEVPQKDLRSISLYEALFTIEKQTDTYRTVVLGSELIGDLHRGGLSC